MEGILHKWTNYISGWQPRWFVLDGGTLSYYDSQEDAWKGCKGSIKISVCEILVHSTDITRVDLTIPGEQYFYLRAINAAERQKWLVALGTAKACLTDNRTRREKELQENTEAIKTKMSELRLYCDLLLKQVNKIKDSEERGDSAEAGEDTGNMVKSTCTTFLKTLEECMHIANHTFSSDMVSQSPPGSPPVAAIKPQKIKPLCHLNLGEKLRESEEANENQSQDSGREGAEEPEKPDIPSHRDQAPSTALEEDDGPPAPYTAGPVTQLEGEGSNPEQEQKHNMDQIKEDGEDEVSRNQREMVSAPDQILPPQDPLLEEEGVDTFFSTMSHRFSDIRLEDDRGIPTQDFLDSCYAIVPVLDKLGSTVFAPVKMDFVGNIKKINQKWLSDPNSFPTLQSIVLHELQTATAQVRNSATEALLWLRRGLRFLKEFLSEVHSGEQDIHGALNNAYGRTLRQYHGWVVRGVFALALRASPSYESFTAALVSQEGDQLKPGFTSGMRRDLSVYLPAMEDQLGILDDLYDEYSLESDEVV
ncbi:pleckstrin homology domain-containing family A member 8 isoform X1 [Gadus morhua]|uniref:Pleckstrin homology domain-containing family A member 8 n=1 Tax=Gadus morhua TaxID=8049 RepID=A0A8C4ZHN2_GADMO|nr:pleckstrin homology domain-containing family A member 8 isoform X1 [Gadus morhua]